jgi:8-oxo-dGTP diphosphatase
VVGIVYEATDLNGRLRVEFDAGTTDDARWFPVEEVRKLPRVELVDFVLGLIA